MIKLAKDHHRVMDVINKAEVYDDDKSEDDWEEVSDEEDEQYELEGGPVSRKDLQNIIHMAALGQLFQD